MSINPFRVSGLKHGANDNSIYVTSYGAKGDGTTDDTAAITAAIAASTAGCTIYFPAGNYLITSTVTFNKDKLRVVGAGVTSTRITFTPTVDSTAAFAFSSGASEQFGSSLSGMYFYAGELTHPKTAIQLSDTSGFIINDVWIDPVDARGWKGGTSAIGIEIKGRELTSISNIRMNADQPIVINPDPNISTPVSTDHLHIYDTYLKTTQGTGNAVIKIADNVIISNFTIDGFNSWEIDKYGLYWVETGVTAVQAINVSISGVRCEQAVDLTGYSFYIDHTKGIQNLSLRNDYAATGQNGALIKGVTNLTIGNSVFPTNNAAKSHLVVDRIVDLLIDNVYWQINTTATLSGMTLMTSMPNSQTAAVLPPWGWYSDSTTATNYASNLSSLISLKKNSLSNSDATSALPLKLNTGSAWTGGSEMVGFYNNNVRKGYVDGNGNIWMLGGSFDVPSGGTTAILGGFFATTAQVGRTGQNANIAGIMTLGIPAKANNTIASAATIAPTALITHITGTVTIQTITAPTPFAQTNGGGVLHLVFDGIAPWNAAGNIFVAGTPTTAGTTVTFIWDNATSKWYPSRIA